jgi:hypothetical protein
MKKLSHILIGFVVALSATAFVVFKSKPAPPPHIAESNPVWFNTIQITDGITVEFEYGSQLQVFVEGDKQLITQLELVLENNVLTAREKNNLQPEKNVKIKVVTPVLINLAKQPDHTHTNSSNIQKCISQASQKKVIIQPVLMQQKIFQVYTVNA